MTNTGVCDIFDSQNTEDREVSGKISSRGSWTRWWQLRQQRVFPITLSPFQPFALTRRSLVSLSALFLSWGQSEVAYHFPTRSEISSPGHWKLLMSNLNLKCPSLGSSESNNALCIGSRLSIQQFRYNADCFFSVVGYFRKQVDIFCPWMSVAYVIVAMLDSPRLLV